MGSIRITNTSQGRLVVNSVKLVLLPGAPVVKDESLGYDSDILELQSMGKITVEAIESGKPISGNEVRKDSGNNEPPKTGQDSEKQEDVRGKGKRPKHYKHHKTTPKKNKEKNTPSAPTVQVEPERTSQEAELNSEVNRMGRTAIIMDRGVVRKQPMNPGMHSTGEPIVPEGSKPEGDDSADDELGSQFVTV